MPDSKGQTGDYNLKIDVFLLRFHDVTLTRQPDKLTHQNSYGWQAYMASCILDTLLGWKGKFPDNRCKSVAKAEQLPSESRCEFPG